MDAFDTDVNTQEKLGNPVETWWNKTRVHVDLLISLLRNIPPSLNVDVALAEIDRAYTYLINAEYPKKAEETRAYLLCSVENLKQVMLAIKSGNRIAILEYYNIAYSYYVGVCRLLLERGIFEPVPRSKKSRVQ